jgi:drug/metabolite transporter (DMT)-like permease
MNPAGPAFALLSAMAWGSGDFFGGLASRLGGLRPALLLSQLFGVIFAVTLVLLVGEAAPTTEGFLWAAAGGLMGILGVGCLYLALAAGTMGLVAPMTGLIAAAIPAVIGIAWFGEPAGPLLLAGMGVALAAVVVISLPDRVPGPTHPAANHAAAPRPSRLREWLLILGSGAGFAGVYLLVDVAHEQGSGAIWTLVGVRVASTTVALGLLAAPLLAGRAAAIRVPRRVVGYTLLTGLGDTGGNLFYILATGLGSLSVTVVLASLYPVSTALWARFLLHERLSRTRLLGVALAIAGALLISLGSLTG